MCKTAVIDIDRCIFCGACRLYCTEKAIILKDRKNIVLAEKCTACGLCVHLCWNGAIRITSEYETDSVS